MRCPVPPWRRLSTKLYTYMNKRLLTAAQERQASVTTINVEQLLRFMTFCRVWRMLFILNVICSDFNMQKWKCHFAGLFQVWLWPADGTQKAFISTRVCSTEPRVAHFGFWTRECQSSRNCLRLWEAIMLLYSVLYITVWKKAYSVQPKKHNNNNFKKSFIFIYVFVLYLLAALWGCVLTVFSRYNNVGRRLFASDVCH